MTVDVAFVVVFSVDFSSDVVVLDGVGVDEKACGFAKASLLRLFPFTRFLPVISLRT